MQVFMIACLMRRVQSSIIPCSCMAQIEVFEAIRGWRSIFTTTHNTTCGSYSVLQLEQGHYEAHCIDATSCVRALTENLLTWNIVRMIICVTRMVLDWVLLGNANQWSSVERIRIGCGSNIQGLVEGGRDVLLGPTRPHILHLASAWWQGSAIWRCLSRVLSHAIEWLLWVYWITLLIHRILHINDHIFDEFAICGDLLFDLLSLLILLKMLHGLVVLIVRRDCLWELHLTLDQLLLIFLAWWFLLAWSFLS